MTDLSAMLDRLCADVEWQRIPVVMNKEARRGYLSECLEYGIETLYITVGKAMQYSESLYTRGTDGTLVSISEDLHADEKRYAFLSAKIAFFRKVQTDVNNIVGYTTDALTVTNADKPYINLASTIEELEKERRLVYYKMIRYALM